MTAPTPQQQAAISEHDHNFIMTAGAGSGKTFVLVMRYLALLEANTDWQINNLVAVTFTKKAAQEMRDRVRDGLQARLNTAIDTHQPDDEITRWSDLLAQVDSARIDTIHGLCATLIRANAAYAGVDPDFAVIDETEARILRDDVIDAVLAEIPNEPGDLSELFTEYTVQNVREVLTDDSLLNAELDPLPDDLLAHWQAAWWQGIVARAGDVLALAERLDIFDIDAPDGDAFSDKIAQVCDQLDRLRDGDPQTCLDALQTINSISLAGGSKPKWGGKDALDAAKDPLKALKSAIKNDHLDKMGACPDADSIDARAAQIIPLWYMLIQRVKTAYQDAKHHNSLLDFNDLENITATLLTDHEAVRSRYQGMEFKHLLVDEFQDTNANQWKIIKHLANLQTPGSVFVVGDEKQSIYGFRGADVSVFGDVQQEIIDAGGRALPLSQSFRTHKPLVGCFNAMFGELLQRDAASPVSGYQVEYGDVMTAGRDQPDTMPMIDFIVINQDIGDERIKTELARTWEAYEIAQYLKRNVGQRMIYDKRTGEHRPLRYDDVAILFRALTNVNLYEAVFKAHDIPFVTVAGRGYYDRQEVWDLLNLLQALHNPADDLALASALRSPLFGLSDDALYALRQTRDESADPDEHGTYPRLLLWDALAQPGDLLPVDERENVAYAWETLDALYRMSGRVMIAELLREALARTGYLAVLTGLPDGARRRGNVEKVLEKAQTSGKITLSAFSRYLHDLSALEVREGEALLEVEGAIKIMSVHASKGLEYPMIIIGDAARDKSGGGFEKVLRLDSIIGLGCKLRDPITYDYQRTFAYGHASYLEGLRDDAESLRLLYVAATRAQDVLVVSGLMTETKTYGFTVKGWMGELLKALSLYDSMPEVFNTVTPYTFTMTTPDNDTESVEGHIGVIVPENYPDEEILTYGRDDAAGLWDDARIKNRQPLDGDSTTPPLVAEVHIQREAQAKHIAATHIADLGGVDHSESKQREFYRNRFRRRLFHDAPAEIEIVSNRTNGVRQAQIGEIVHEALRWWAFPKSANDDEYKQRLRSYAWRQGITDDHQCENAVDRAYNLIQKFANGDLFNWIDAADETYRELPFIYQRENRIIHGIIDTLLRHDDVWTVVDYKTSYVRGNIPDAITDHARRYHLQVGVYAEAVSAQLGGVVPRTRVHYIRYNHVVDIPEAAWRSALAQSLTDRIQKIVDEE